MTATLRERRRHGRVDPLRETRHLGARAAREFADWLAFLEVANKAPRTIDVYQRTVAGLLISFPEHELADFTDGDLLQFLSLYPPRSRHLNLSHLSSFFTWARKTRRIQENPCELLPSIKYKPQRAYDLFSEAEVDALCGLAAPDGQLMTLLFWAGLRRAEARNLTGKRFDFERGQIIVIDGAKGGRDRKVPMIRRVQAAALELVDLEGVGRDDFVWHDRPGGHGVRRSKPVANSVFQRWWTDALEDADVRYRRPHLTRHTFATTMRALGLPMEQLQQILGHESIRTTADTYLTFSTEAIGDNMRVLVGDVA